FEGLTAGVSWRISGYRNDINDMIDYDDHLQKYYNEGKARIKGDFDVIESRLKARKGHFFKTQMLVTQFETLQEPGADERDVL
ncbi:hypothetical protein MJM45_33125, partial [Salmonella enterica subsp. enterica serovar Kentucky]|nr:hypothetical protein [Salmonella enterica subsp. enterica serovar Kentucky]